MRYRYSHNPTSMTTNFKQLLKTIGPGLLFASSSIGTSHLVLSTRAGAHHGMIFFWIILAALLFKYPFYDFGPRYANATGHSIIKGYKEQGKWAVGLFMLIIFISMFAVTGALSAVSGGLLSSMLGMSGIPMPILVGGLMVLTGILLLMGRYAALDNFIKIISVVLLVTVVIAFVAVIVKGPIEPVADFVPNTNILEGAGLVLLVSLIGWMPSGMEASAMHSIWTVEKIQSENYHPTLKQNQFDFNLGYMMAAVLAFMFLTIGAFTVYGSGELLAGSSTAFSNKLLAVFTNNLGDWAYPVLAIAAFVTIYGTLVAAWDAFTRGFARCLRAFKFDEIENNEEQQQFLNRYYSIFLPVIGLGGFILFYQFTGSMITILTLATVFSFLSAPVICLLNFRAIQSSAIPESHRPANWMVILSYIGLVVMVLFTLYYIWDLVQNGVGGH